MQTMALGLLSAGATLSKGGDAGTTEDACFLQGSWIGVADGVGGWRELGISSRDFSRQLMENCRTLASQEGEALHPKEVMKRAVEGTKCLGSSTVVLGCIQGSSFLAVNLGDSGFILLRSWQVVEASRPLQASFSMPFQVGYDPNSEEPQFDDPDLADIYDIPVRMGDVIVMATDGLFDYLYHNQIIKVLQKCFDRGGTVEDAAAMLVKKARHRMQNVTPYFDACKEHGKRVDDLTVLVAEVTDATKSGREGIVELTQEEVVTCEFLKLKDLVLTHPGHSEGLSSESLKLEALAVTNSLEPGHCHDAFFVKGSCMGLAVEICNYADIGVGTFCGKFSKELAQKCAKLAGKFTNPKDVIQAAAASKSRCKVHLTSTIIVASLVARKDQDGTVKQCLCIANMGDSRVMVIRDWKTVAITPPMCHSSGDNLLDNPFKIGNSVGAGMPDSEDNLSVIAEHELDVCEGDLVLCGNAGLFNNLHEATIMKLLEKNPNNLEGAAQKLTRRAKQLMLEPAPWVVSLSRNTEVKCRHISDATVILARVVQN